MKYEFEADYKKMYLTLFSAVTESIEQIHRHNYTFAQFVLQQAQADCEEIYINGSEEE